MQVFGKEINLTPNRKCRNRCKADLGFDPQLVKACEAACRTDDPPLSGDDFLQGLPQYAQNDFLAEQQLYQAEEANLTLPFLFIGVAVVVLLYLILR